MNNQQRARNWRLVRALRSGKYRQAFGALSYIMDGRQCYCAEGVACEISKRSTWSGCVDVLENSALGGGIEKYIQSYGKSCFNASPPDEVLKYYGWTFHGRPPFWYWNDARRLTLPQIADKLEAWLLEQDQEASRNGTN